MALIKFMKYILFEQEEANWSFIFGVIIGSIITGVTLFWIACAAELWC